MGHTSPARAVYVDGSGPSDPRGHWWEIAQGQVPLKRIASSEGQVDAIREEVWGMPHGGSDFVTVVIPEQFEKPSLWQALRRPSFRLKLRLLQESGVAICDVSTTDAHADEPLPEHCAVRVLVSDARAASLRAAAYAASLGFADTRALYFAPSEEQAKNAHLLWQSSGSPLQIETVAMPFRDIAEPLNVYAHALIDNDPSQAILYVVPEIVVTGWRRILHNFRELHIKRSVLFESPRIMLVAVPYHLH
jgi:hypothetical protein